MKYFLARLTGMGVAPYYRLIKANDIDEALQKIKKEFEGYGENSRNMMPCIIITDTID